MYNVGEFNCSVIVSFRSAWCEQDSYAIFLSVIVKLITFCKLTCKKLAFSYLLNLGVTHVSFQVMKDHLASLYNIDRLESTAQVSTKSNTLSNEHCIVKCMAPARSINPLIPLLIFIIHLHHWGHMGDEELHLPEPCPDIHNSV